MTDKANYSISLVVLLVYGTVAFASPEEKQVFEVSALNKRIVENETKIEGFTSSTEGYPQQTESVSDKLIACEKYNKTGSVCDRCEDIVRIWDVTIAGEIASVPCASLSTLELTGSATRRCDSDGRWEVKANYSICLGQLAKHINKTKEESKREKEESKVEQMEMENTLYVYLVGFIVSNISMIAAIFIFARYNKLKSRQRNRDDNVFRCLRNKIHIQLLLAITIKNFAWMALLISVQHYSIFDKEIECKVIFTCFRFFLVAQYSWMFVEGLYLFMVVVKALLTNVLEFKHCMLVGWGIPVVVILMWIIANVTSTTQHHCWYHGSLFQSYGNLIEAFSITICLLVNGIFLISVVYTLVMKLRTAAVVEMKQYKKAVKATAVLIPLLGGTYILLYWPYNFSEELPRAAWMYSTAFIQSVQGFIVSLVYCFLNGEVRSSILKSHRRWKDEKTLPHSSDHWWQRRRRSSNFTSTRREDTETETCPYSSRNSRRISEDTLSSSRRGSNVADNVDFNLNIKTKKATPLKASPLAKCDQLLENTQPSDVKSQENLKLSHTVVFLSPLDAEKIQVCVA